jgi:predicted dehydrogenase
LTLKAIYSRSLKSAKALGEAAGNVDLYSDDSGSGKSYHDLLQRTDIHAVILALPILSQTKYVETALAAGKHVLSEKPIAGDIEAAEQLIQYYNTKIDKNKVFWGVAENFRFLDSFLYAQQEIHKLGKVLGFRVKMFMMIKPGNKGYGQFMSELLPPFCERLLTSAI